MMDYASTSHNIFNLQTSLARRAAFLLSVFLMSIGSVWGEEVTLETTQGNVFHLNSYTFTTTTVIRFYVDFDGGLWIGDGYSQNTHTIYANSEYYKENGDNKYYELVFMSFFSASEQTDYLNRGMQYYSQNNDQITKVTIETPAAVVDDFISTATPTTEAGNSYELTDRSLTEWTLDMTTPLTYVASPKYARFQVLKDGTAVDPTSILSIAGETPIVCTSQTNGKYVYNATGLGALTVKLEHITAGEFPKYQVVCFLSDDEGTVTSGTLTKEPDPDLKYTYSFTNPPVQAVTRTLSDLVSSVLSANSQTLETATEIEFNIQSYITNEYGKDANALAGQWYTCWYIEDNAGVRQSLKNNWGALSGTWVIGTNDVLTNNERIVSWKTTGSNNYDFTNNAGKLKFVAPSGTHLSDYSGYKFVCETSDEYDGTTAAPNVIFYIPIPSPITFEYDGTPTNTDVVQTLESRTSTTSVTLDNNLMSTTGIKYARFYVVDGTGTAVAPTDAAHLLTVAGGTLCTIGESGYYVYNGGSDITLPTVTLSSTGDVRDYKVVCWLATTLANINPNDGTTPLVEEPDIDVAYTFSFKKPSVTATVDKTADITWSASSMTMDATAGTPADWDTSWADLSKAQYVKWYVVGADGTTKQPLELGSARQNGKWTIGLSSPFTVSDNVAVLTGQTTFTAENWNTWGKPVIYAPADQSYADVYNYKVICEVSEEASATATPNVRYTFSFTKDFLGSNKSTFTSSIQREVLASADAKTCTLSEVTLPAGTKYARFYLLDGSDNMVAPTDKLTVSDSKGITVTGYENYGFYVYNESGIGSTPTVTLTLAAAELNLYRVVMVTSTDKAVHDASDNVISEPDYDTRKTWMFKYPTAHVAGTGEVEWSPMSMAVTPDIDALKGTGYLEGLGTNYHIVWTVENAGTPLNLVTGMGRQAGKWTVSRSGANATFYAPTGQTFDDVKDLKLVGRLYETATGEDASDLALTYTVSIIKTQFLGTEKPGCERRQETVEEIAEEATSVTVPLGNALTAFGATAKYARIWLTKDDVVVDPSDRLSLGDFTAFTHSAAQYSYYITDANGITLSDITLTAESGVKFTQYKVHVALSADAAVGATSYAPAAGSNRTASLDSYEPDYDLLYAFDFAYAAKGKVIHKYVTWDDHMKELDLTSEIDFAELGEAFYIKWYVLDGSGNTQALAGYNQLSGSSNPTDLWFLYMQNHQQPYPYQLESGSKFLFLASNKDQWGNTLTLGTNNEANPMVFTPHDTPLQDLSDYTVVCLVSKTPPTYEGNTVTAEPDETTCTKYVFHFNANGENPFIGEEKTSIKTAAETIEITNSSVTSLSDIDLTTNKKVKAMTDGGFVPKYVRWQVFDQDDNLVDGVLTANGTTTKVDGLGEYIYNDTGTTDLLKGLSIDVSGQTDTDLMHYRIIGLLSDCSPDDNLVLNGTKLKEEPDFDLKVTVTFETAFRGKLTATAVEREVVFTQLATKWDYNTSGQEEFMVQINESGTVELQSKSGTTLTEHPLNILADLKTATGNTYTSLNDMENIYVRWYLERKDGSATFVKGAIRKHNNSSIHFLPNNGDAGADLAHGFYWYKNGTTYSSTGGNAQDAVMAKFVQKGEFLTDGINITDYNLVLNVSTHPYSAYDASYTNADHTINHEPDDLDIRYVFNFQNRDFPAENIETVKTVYKTALYDKTTGNITPDLFTDYTEVLTHLSTSIDDFRTNGYLRWYVVEKDGSLVSDMADWEFAATQTYTKHNTYGYYINKPSFYDYNKTTFNPTFTLPGTYDKETAYKHYQVVCVVTNDQTGQDLPTTEPSTMKVKYIFNLILTEDEFANLPFIHYKGQTGRDWITPTGSNGSQEQKVWNSSTGEPEDFTGDIRQGVHTWEYDVYVKPGDERALTLPFENYTTTGNNLEPRGYVRWYDWKTDTKVVNNNFTFRRVGTSLTDGDRGLFGLCLSANPTQANVGVTFTADATFSEPVDIACDVSKYSDGITMVGDKYYLVHEPTLSNRYIFHVYPADMIATKLTQAKSDLETGEAAAAASGKLSDLEAYLEKMVEHRCKMVVSLGTGKVGSFALRMDKTTIDDYLLESGGSYVTPTAVKWYSYVEADGKVWKKKINDADDSNRITSFTFDKFQGDYTELGTTTTKTINEAQKYHVVAYVGEGTSYDVNAHTGTYAPVAHYELYFMEAPAIPLDELPTQALNRTDAYMTYHYQLAGLLDFDGNPDTNPNVVGHEAEYYSTANWSDAPTSSSDNMTYEPFKWDEIQYGYTYPQLLSTIKNGYSGTIWHSPEHGDYIMLKSMNVTNISSEMNTPPYYYHWWNATELYDYTHTYTDDTKYGSFLYTDASNESRSIATIPFTGSLCSGSTLYFTAAVADMTSGTIKPQLVVRISSVDEHGNRTPLVAFHTCDILTTGGTTGVWNQVYGQSTVPLGFDDSNTSYIAEVINYANDTNGADFAIDQIAIYISTAKVKAETTSTLCDDTNKVKVKITADAENLINTVGAGNKVNLYYRLFERNEDGNHVIRENEALIGEGVYSDEASAPKGYGVVANFTADYADLQTTATSLPAGQTSGFYLSEETGTVVFQLAEREFVLDPSKIYFVSIYTIGSDKPGDTEAEGAETAGWGNPYQGNQCTIYSNDINPQRIYMELVEGEDASDGTVEIGCGATEVEKTFSLVMKYPKTSGGHDDYDDIKFDYFLGIREEYKAAQTTDGLNDALAAFRAITGQKGAYASSADLPGAYKTEGNVIKKYMDEGLLLLSASTTFTHTFSTAKAGMLEFMAIPIEKQLPDNREVCSPIDILFNVKTGSGGPELVIGFDNVDYTDPDLVPAKRGVRLGLEQLTKMQTGGYKLHIPVHAYQDKNKEKTNKLFFSDGWLTISETNDPTVELGKKIAKVVPSDDSSTDAYVNNSYMYLTLDFSGCEPMLHEGFFYEVSTIFYDESEKETAEANRCNSDLYLVFKIVPEFVTWESKRVTTTFYNANWNNDANWQRSERAELYKGADLGTQNTATSGHPNGYLNNLELNTNLNTHPGYVPMKFTYVTMPTDNHAPDLNGMTYEEEGSVQTGGHLIKLSNTLITNTSPVGTYNYDSESTFGIRYDMLVRYGTHAEGGEGCFGHRYLNGSGEWADGTPATGDFFDCEKFDGNICREIYFKPGAELLQQQRLVYQKAWVEKELTANKWYLMSSPLKGTYAGDMYVPTSMTNVADGNTVSGRQVTEAFQPMTFTTTTYSRTKYPVYQRSWGLDQAKVYTKVDDIRATDYSAKLHFGSLSTNIVEWSHTYNNVQVPYTALGGFSIRAHKKDQTVPALIRLPKDDVTYDYYEWDGTSHPEPAAGSGVKSTPKGTAVLGQLVFDRTSADQDKVELTLSTVQSQGADDSGNTYYLVGNPFMGSLDMGKFFAQNIAFGNTYYTYEGSVLTAVDAKAAPSETVKHIIKPLQAFFVKCAAGSAPDKVTFNRSMMTDGNWETGTAYTPNTNPAPALTPALTLTTEGSVATVVLNEEATAGFVQNEDVETLFDSNLSDVPMVYTVAGGMAVSINQMPELGMLPFGVVSNGEEPVNVQCTTLNAQRSTLYVYDAVTGESVSVDDSSSVTIQPNDYGRYFLTSTEIASPVERQGEASVVISVRGSKVSVTATDNLQQVRAVSISGATMYQAADCGTTCQFQLQPGTYVIEAESAEGRKTVKVFVR